MGVGGVENAPDRGDPPQIDRLSRGFTGDHQRSCSSLFAGNSIRPMVFVRRSMESRDLKRDHGSVVCDTRLLTDRN